MSEIKVGNRRIAITNSDKILFPRAKVSKADLVDYYLQVAPYMLPYLKNRLISMQRFPSGIAGEGFYQKDAGDYFPDWIDTKKIQRSDGGMVDYVIVSNASTLVYLATQAVITFHIWLSKVDKINYPDRIIFDFDPSSPRSFTKIRKAALMARDILESYGLTPYVMTTGSKGLHVVIPIKRELPFDAVKDFARSIAMLMVEQAPEMLTLEIRKKKRGGRIFVDFLRNEFGQTGVTPYSVRPLPAAAIATPLTWEEVENGRLSPQQWTIKNIFTRLSTMGDPWKGMMRRAGSVKKARVLFKKRMK